MSSPSLLFLSFQVHVEVVVARGRGRVGHAELDGVLADPGGKLEQVIAPRAQRIVAGKAIVAHATGELLASIRALHAERVVKAVDALALVAPLLQAVQGEWQAVDSRVAQRRARERIQLAIARTLVDVQLFVVQYHLAQANKSKRKKRRKTKQILQLFNLIHR